uniref:Uncharacterized protein n=1 Tax=Vertebrata isogona TaxID=2006944 RepID=A0A1Z1MFS1_9FLOR|nr:hypothetical protein [Vertebrata isogona]ARW64665.1 hypothetical protein [Vertebrata isogona]
MPITFCKKYYYLFTPFHIFFITDLNSFLYINNHCK